MNNLNQMCGIGAAALMLVLLGTPGCNGSPSSVASGMSQRQVEHLWGQPDVIGERAGEMERLFVPTKRPDVKWQVTTTRLYYVQRGREIVLRNDRVKEVNDIPADYISELHKLIDIERK